MKNIAVIGAGTMGNGIAHTFAQSGFKVQLIDISEVALKKGVATHRRGASTHRSSGGHRLWKPQVGHAFSSQDDRDTG